MPKSTESCTNLLALLFKATTWTGFAVNDTGTPLTNLYVALYTDDPGIGADPRNNEVTAGAWTNYARVAVARNAGGWTVAAGTSENTATITFTESSGGTGCTLTHCAIVTTASGDGDILYAGSLGSNRVVATGIQPQFLAGALVVTET